MRRTIVFADPQALAPASIGGSVALVRDLRALDTEASRDASQPNVAQRPLLGRAPLIGRRNLLLNTEALTESYWTRRNLFVSPTTGNAWTLTSEPGIDIHPGITGPRDILQEGDDGWASVELRAGTHARVVIGFHENAASNSAGRALFDLTTSQVIATAGGSGYTIRSADIESLEDGWLRCSLNARQGSNRTLRGFIIRLAHPSRVGTLRSDDTRFSPEGHEHIFMRFPQVERVSRTPYQRIGASDLDITEPVTGLPSPAFLRFDLSDDQLVHAFPDGFVGEVLIFGRNASWIAPDVTVAPGGTLTIGPQGIAGLPEAFLAHLGDIVGWMPIGQSLDAQARAALLTHYRPKGARPFFPALFEGASWNDAALWRDFVNITGAET